MRSAAQTPEVFGAGYAGRVAVEVDDGEQPRPDHRVERRVEPRVVRDGLGGAAGDVDEVEHAVDAHVAVAAAARHEHVQPALLRQQEGRGREARPLEEPCSTTAPVQQRGPSRRRWWAGRGGVGLWLTRQLGVAVAARIDRHADGGRGCRRRRGQLPRESRQQHHRSGLRRQWQLYLI